MTSFVKNPGYKNQVTSLGIHVQRHENCPSPAYCKDGWTPPFDPADEYGSAKPENREARSTDAVDL
ncbi:MAG: hypothetical protein ACK42D_02785 [Candidatus Paceibacteria bacterium]